MAPNTNCRITSSSFFPTEFPGQAALTIYDHTSAPAILTVRAERLADPGLGLPAQHGQEEGGRGEAGQWPQCLVTENVVRYIMS